MARGRRYQRQHAPAHHRLALPSRGGVGVPGALEAIDRRRRQRDRSARGSHPRVLPAGAGPPAAPHRRPPLLTGARLPDHPPDPRQQGRPDRLPELSPRTKEHADAGRKGVRQQCQTDLVPRVRQLRHGRGAQARTRRDGLGEARVRDGVGHRLPRQRRRLLRRAGHACPARPSPSAGDGTAADPTRPPGDRGDG